MNVYASGGGLKRKSQCRAKILPESGRCEALNRWFHKNQHTRAGQRPRHPFRIPPEGNTPGSGPVPRPTTRPHV